MGTRGVFGFVHDGTVKITYNHFDSYPEGLGVKVLEWLRTHLTRVHAVDGTTVELHSSILDRIDNLVMVDESGKPTAEQRRAVAAYSNPHVSMGDDWYAALHKCQGDPQAVLDSGYMLDGGYFALDSTFCEWGYLIDVDREALEVYEGLGVEPAAGRWAGVDGVNEDTPPIARIDCIGFSDVCEPMSSEAFVARVSRAVRDARPAPQPFPSLPQPF